MYVYTQETDKFLLRSLQKSSASYSDCENKGHGAVRLD